MIHHHVNMAAFLKLGTWLDMLREQGVYDNTRIIPVSDHGRNLPLTDGAVLEDGKDLYLYHALLMVKDFDSHGALCEDSSFMTNADVPTLVLEDLVESPVNPFTGKPINGRENRMEDQIVTISYDWDTRSNRGNTFSLSKWYRVDHEVLKPKAWSYMGEH